MARLTAAARVRLGTVYQLKRHGSSYIHNQLHAFAGGNDGEQPWGGVIFGPDGALYGTTTGGGVDCRNSFQLATAGHRLPHRTLPLDGDSAL